MIVYVPQDVYERLNERLKDIPDRIPDVMRNTINDTAKNAREKILDEVQKKYVVKTGGFNKEVKIEKATLRNWQATIHTEGRHIPLYKFRIKKNRGEDAAQAQVLTGGMLKELTLKGGDNGKDLKAFVQKVGKGGHYGVFRRIESDERARIQGMYDKEKRRKHGNETLLERLGKRLKKRYIRQLYGLSAPQMLESERVYPIVQRVIMEDLRNNLEIHIESVMEGLQ